MSNTKNKYDIALVLNRSEFEDVEFQKSKEQLNKNGIRILSSAYASIDIPENINLIILLVFPTIYIARGFFTEVGKKLFQVLISQVSHLLDHKKSKDPFVLGYRIRYENTTIYFNVNCPLFDAKMFLKKSPEILQIVFDSIKYEIDEEILYLFIKTNPSFEKYVALVYTRDVGPKYIFDFSTKEFITIENPDLIEQMIKNLLQL